MSRADVTWRSVLTCKTISSPFQAFSGTSASICHARSFHLVREKSQLQGGNSLRSGLESESDKMFTIVDRLCKVRRIRTRNKMLEGWLHLEKTGQNEWDDPQVKTNLQGNTT